MTLGKSILKQKIGLVGLGKMGYNIALNLLEQGYEVVVNNRSPQKIEQIVEEANALGAISLEELISKLEAPRVLWLMVPNDAVNAVTTELFELLEPGDTVIDGGNTFYEETIKNAKKFTEANIEYLDVGVSGGPSGARDGASLMIGGNEGAFKKLEPLFRDLAVTDGYAYLGKSGAGHFTKMVHNGIEYGMMQAIAEGFDILKNAEFNLDLVKVMNPYKNGSVIESALINWLDKAFNRYGTDLEKVSGVAEHMGEGAWTVETAKRMGIEAKVIEDALNTRIKSQNNPNYQTKIISALRGEFGGHQVTNNKPCI